MLTEYIQTALRLAHYEIMESGRYWGEIPGLDGVWAEGETLESCRDELREVLEGWLILGLRLGHKIPVLNGIDLNTSEAA
jgi:predicted RNase H-like HicB family nuclease